MSFFDIFNAAQAHMMPFLADIVWQVFLFIEELEADWTLSETNYHKLLWQANRLM